MSTESISDVLPKATAPRAVASLSSARPTQPPRIWIVEDNQLFRDLLVDFLGVA
jgi:hypothetical protein